MTEQELSTVIAAIQNAGSTPEGLQLATTLFKLTSDTLALETIKKLPNAKKVSEVNVVTNKQSNNHSLNSKKKNYLKFTNKEIDAMSEPVKILLIYSGYEIKYRTIKNTFQVRFRRDGYNIELCGKDLNALRTKFLTAVEQAIPHKKPITPLLKDYINEWISIKKTTVKESTLKGYIDLTNTHIIPVFGDKHLDEIKRADIQNYLSDLTSKEKYRTAEKLKVQLKAIFDVAVSDYNFKSPMAKVELANYEVKKGKSLSLSEEKTVVDYCVLHKDKPVCSAILILLYTGMRVGELVSAVLYENYIECETEKIRKGKAKEFRKIPISPMLKKIMQYIDFEAAKTVKRDYINRRFQKILQGRHTHELRYTFITRAKECGCNLELVMLWDGHKFDKDIATSAVDRGYTTYSNDYYFKEIEKVNYEL